MTDWTHSSKYLAFDAALAEMDRLRSEGKRIVQCHGTFDLVHPGHVIHFEEAKDKGDVLVVTFTSESHVNKGPGRPYFNDALRFKSLAGLECVDYVIAIPFPAAVEAIEVVRPNFYCKGKEYEEQSNDLTGNIADDVTTVERFGGEMAYVGSVVFSSTRLLNQNFDTYSSEVGSFCRSMAQANSGELIRATVDGFAKLKVMVIGDLIFDRYTTVAVQGLTSKNQILSTRYKGDDTQAGGSLAVFRHIREFAPLTKIVGFVGTEPWVDGEIANCVPPDCDGLVRSEFYTTIVKQRFVEEQKPGVELSKLFSVNFIDADHPDTTLQDRLLQQVDAEIDDYDVVLVMDFGHGVMFERLRELVQDRAKFLAINCQTNSNNYGFNILNRRYRRADSFSLDNAEITLACGQRAFDHSEVLAGLRTELGAGSAWLTRGQVATIGQDSDGGQVIIPPLESRVVDTIGAGDAFCSLASLAAASGETIEVSTFLGQLAGGQAVRYVGNREHVSKVKLLKAAQAMLAV